MTSGYQAWPSSLPLLIVHGDADKVTDCSASAEFVEKVTKRGAKDASFKAFEGYYVRQFSSVAVHSLEPAC